MRQWTIDAFATGPFRGNPACVLEPFDVWPTDAWMQALAAENNQAETAYLLKTADPDRFGLRWFTPTLEAPLCGHATLAAAHVLFEELGVDVAMLSFETLSGVLTVRRADDQLEMDFPADPPRRTEVPEGLAEALGVRPREVWAGAYLVAVVDDETTVRQLRPDLGALKVIGGEATGGAGQTVVVAQADAGADYAVVSRFFAPGFGIPEDPATGSAHCILMPLFGDKLGAGRLKFHQAYPGRGGDLECENRGARVLLRGRGFTVMESQLRLEPARN
ncbi:PhzF family phenazine biosynthesis protein [Caulobacter vibrioides]|uniref:PhzF family phenazine biosynthesis protein n=1 Tax=Caulobacter vibrioides TaxID=155892 RepID=UPI000BB5005C|nr:PhzF family phenazine biosynthesis protein [Caulobacter vibrioides]ATC26105.1 PhzF family phenazine biosynthesis protein [Caulobacter vibrioides]AZH14243.1 PhzF family phenazine biosynthesis protein [Caulobacter vibrioides]PLR11042.1 PhzF family phenazine biosynthesis protein [Caulobacter vibrioides]